MPSFRDASAAWYEEQRAALRQQIELIESGRLFTGERTAESSQWVDTTDDSIKRAKSQLARIDALLEKYAKRQRHAKNRRGR